MQFRQKYASFARPLSYRTTFDFGEEELTYTFDNSKQKTGASVPYRAIANRTVYKKTKFWEVKYVYIFYIVFCVMTAAYSFLANDIRFISALFVPTMAFFIYALFTFFQKPPGLTTLPMQQPHPPIMILDDKQHQAILDEIRKRRHEQIKSKLGQVDYDKPYYEEARKFTWLREEDIISEKEFAYARQKIAAMREKTAIIATHTKNIN